MRDWERKEKGERMRKVEHGSICMNIYYCMAMWVFRWL